MGIYIKGMEMPTTCGKCKIKNAIKCNRWELVRSVLLDRHRDCPLVPVPPHGDLIDREALTAAICSRLCIKDLTYLSPAEKAIVDEINNIPTVISAEPEEEGET